MEAIDILEKIREGINEHYISGSKELVEDLENMNVPLYKGDGEVILIKPEDNEKNKLWACLSETTEREIADYIAFTKINNEVICFIFELKKTKTIDSTHKATKQILSTHPLVKMIYEKTTGLNPKELKTLGLRVFGTVGGKRQSKQSAKDRRDVQREVLKDNLGIGYFVQSNKTSKLSSLSSIFNLAKDRLGQDWLCNN